MPHAHSNAEPRHDGSQPTDNAVTIRVRDVVRKGVYDLDGGEPMFRVPYDLFNPVGPVQMRGDLIHYLQAGEMRTGTKAPGTLGDAHPGERVIVQLPPAKAENEWWLCEVMEVDGVAVD
jgi:hypothetical protein